MIHSTLKYFMVVSDFKYQRIKTNANISNRLDCIDGKIFYFHTSQYYRLQTKFGARYCFNMCLSVHRGGVCMMSLPVWSHVPSGKGVSVPGPSGGSRISPRWGCQPSRGGGYQHTILPNLPKNCMKLKEFWPWGRTSKILLCRSATGYSFWGGLCLGGSLSGGLCPVGDLYHRDPLDRTPPRWWRAGGTHPTRMLSN